MIKSLSIKNYALIQSLEMTPSPNLNIITGETGAGKSIMLGAVGAVKHASLRTPRCETRAQECVTLLKAAQFHAMGPPNKKVSQIKVIGNAPPTTNYTIYKHPLPTPTTLTSQSAHLLSLHLLLDR